MREPWGLWDLPEGMRGKRALMPIDSNVLYCAARILGDFDPPSTIQRRRGVIGSGFIVKIESETMPEAGYPYIVTAAHVVRGQTDVEVQLPIPQASGGLYPPIQITDWVTPIKTLDVAVALWTDPSPVFGIRRKDIMPTARATNPMLGGEVFYVGILTPLDRPMVRSGTVGAINQTGIPDLDPYEYTAHLIDCRSYDGFSGSPVFALDERPVLKESGTYQDRPLGDMAYSLPLAGMFTKHLADKSHDSPSRYGVGVMVRSPDIMLALMSDDLVAQRRHFDKLAEEQARNTGPRLVEAKRGADTDVSQGFTAFEGLAQRLLQVPKEEADDVHRSHEG